MPGGPTQEAGRAVGDKVPPCSAMPALQRLINATLFETAKVDGAFAVHVLARRLIQDLPAGVSVDDLMQRIEEMARERGIPTDQNSN